ncbi:MAG: circularly permuted type 2 ATP-grasp protein, partial [Allosphingosinicella sp.]
MAEPTAFDELWGASCGEQPRPGFEPLVSWLTDLPPAELDRRQQAAEVAFRSLGITFAVYGHEEAAERIIPFDIIPRIFTAREWAGLSAGLEQRVRALNAFIDDIYGARRILADGVIPADIVLANNQFCIPCAGARPPHGVYAHICGIDLVRTGADDFWVLEDNARTPSGVSYMLENREAMLRLCPELFRILPVQPVDSYPELLRDTIRSVAPDAAREPTCVLLTPGHFNSAYYEHSFLADNMGIELVEGRDLVVDDDQVFMRTIDGPVKVDVI